MGCVCGFLWPVWFSLVLCMCWCLWVLDWAGRVDFLIGLFGWLSDY